jgi:hypothetical protein
LTLWRRSARLFGASQRGGGADFRHGRRVEGVWRVGRLRRFGRGRTNPVFRDGGRLWRGRGCRIRHGRGQALLLEVLEFLEGAEIVAVSGLLAAEDLVEHFGARGVLQEKGAELVFGGQGRIFEQNPECPGFDDGQAALDPIAFD